MRTELGGPAFYARLRHSKLEPILVYAAVLTTTDKIEPCYFLTAIGLSLMLRNAMLP